MTGIEELEEIFSKQRTAFVPYLTFGDPNMDLSSQLLADLSAIGADVIEVGIPFADPMADGEINRQSAERALAAGTTFRHCLDRLERLRSQGMKTPVVLFGYLNSFLQYGIEELAQRAKTAGVAGVLIVDLPLESSSLIRESLATGGVALISLVSPTTTPDRLSYLADSARGFVYCVARTGTTGKSTDLDQGFFDYLERVQSTIKKPVAVGFGISRPEQVVQLRGRCQGVVVGSSLVRRLAESWSGGSESSENVRRAIRDHAAQLMQPLKEI